MRAVHNCNSWVFAAFLLLFFALPTATLTSNIPVYMSGVCAPALDHGQKGYAAVEVNINPIALRTVETLWSFGRSECNRVKQCTQQAVYV